MVLMAEELSQRPDDTRTLIMMRHAEADWGMDDFNRPLTSRGHLQARAAGEWLHHTGTLPEMIVSSAALRTRQTTTWVCEALGEKAPTASLDERLYNAPARMLRQCIENTPDSVRSMMLVAHLPGVQDAAMDLMSSTSDYESLMDISYGFPPSSIAVFEVETSWSELLDHDARLVSFRTF